VRRTLDLGVGGVEIDVCRCAWITNQNIFSRSANPFRLALIGSCVWKILAVGGVRRRNQKPKGLAVYRVFEKIFFRHQRDLRIERMMIREMTEGEKSDRTI
jgi:hypothetical protein